MPIRVTCQGCAAQYSVGKKMAGKRVRCKRCGSMFDIPRENGPGETHIEDILAQEAPDVGFKDDDKLFKEPVPQTPVSQLTGQPLEGEVHDELEVAASTGTEKKEVNEAALVGRPDDERTSTGKRQSLKLKRGARSFSEKAKIGEMTAARMAQQERDELRSRIEMRTVFSDFRKNPLSKLVMAVGVGAFLFYHLWMAVHYGDWLVLRNMGIRLGVYAMLSIPFGMLGIQLTALACRFKPTRPLAFVVAVTAAAPPGILALGFLTEDDTWRIVAAAVAIPLTFWIFHLAFQQGILRNLAAFLGMCAFPLLLTWAGSSSDDVRKLGEEYLSDAPPAALARAAEKARRALPAVPEASTQPTNPH